MVLGSLTDDGLRIEMLAESPLHVGLNRVSYRLSDEATGDPVERARVTQAPVMHMPMHDHGCPFTDPIETDSPDGVFAGEIVFIMPSVDGTWDNEVTVHDLAADTTHTVLFETLDVGGGMRQMLRVGEGPDRRVYAFTLNFAEPPAVGSNDFVLTIHQREGDFSFPELAGMDVVVTPFMPAHGHGSTDNVDPVYVAAGKYEGSVNLTMAGEWTIDFAVSNEAEDIGTVTFELSL